MTPQTIDNASRECRARLTPSIPSSRANFVVPQTMGTIIMPSCSEQPARAATFFLPGSASAWLVLLAVLAAVLAVCTHVPPPPPAPYPLWSGRLRKSTSGWLSLPKVLDQTKCSYDGGGVSVNNGPGRSWLETVATYEVTIRCLTLRIFTTTVVIS